MKRPAAVLLLVLLMAVSAAANAASVVFLGGAGDSDLFGEAFSDLKLPEGISFEYYCVPIDPWEKIQRRAKQADVLIINALVVELRKLVSEEIDFSKTKLYALASRRLPKNVPAQEPAELSAYRSTRLPENYRNMVCWIVHRELDKSVRFAAPRTIPEIGVTHPASETIFGSLSEYRAWGLKSGHFKQENPLVAFAVHSASIQPVELALFRHLTDEFERQGMNVAMVYGDEVRVLRELLLDERGVPMIGGLLALSFKFKSGLGEPLRLTMKQLDLPVFNVLRLYRQTTPDWEKSPQGMNDFSVAFGFVAPEISGMIEPSLLFGSRNSVDAASGRTIQTSEPFPGAIRIAAQRMKKWIGLRKKANAEKRIAVFIYNGSGGKQTIGASYLNVPRSLFQIVRTLAGEKYNTGGLEQLEEAALTKLLLRTARNVGSWAPGELDELSAYGERVRLPRTQYRKWFAELPRELQDRVVAEWGRPEDSRIMTVGGDFLLPMLRRGNLVILPEPMRGWLDDPHKLVHSSTIAPHHQYLAVYLWLRHEFRADAMIHLGRHGSSEWLPGKQLGLSEACAPWVVRGDIPEIYPYISDGIGEGIVAKRRASAVMIDHLTPFLKIPEQDRFLSGLQQKIADCQTADPSLKSARETALFRYAEEHGLTEKLAIKPSDPDRFHKLEDYAEDRRVPAPFGLHSFGVSPSEKEVEAMLGQLPETERPEAGKHLRNSGQDEMNALLRALSGHFIEPGPSGDPLRNPRVLPVGRNFYSFDPAKIPTREAMEKGAKLAEELLSLEKQKHGRYPRTAAIILWAGETTRTDGVNEAMALSLMGMRPQYDANGRVTGVMPVPGARLGRPRIDVLITTSGAYRDQFGDLIRLLDRAQRQASRLTDAENFLRRGTEEAVARLKAQGYSDREAADWSARRIFFPAPGTYGTRVNRLAGASGYWEKEDELAALYGRSMGYSVDEKGDIGEARAALSSSLARVEAMLHSRSSHVYGVTDIDDMYQYFGGLSLAVRKSSGKTPSEYIVDQRTLSAEKVTSLKSFLGAELDSRLYSREWIEAMLKENYSGGKTLARMLDNVWGWQAVTPENIRPSDWRNLYEIYVEDRYRLNLKEFFAANNEWAFQSMTGRMLEAVRKDYWTAGLPVRQSLASAYARSVIRQGVACCDHTCNNPLLNQMVVNLISMPGVLSPDLVMKFQVAVEKAAARNIDSQVRERRELQKQLTGAFGKRKEDSSRPAANPASKAGEQKESAPKRSEALPVKGFKMKAERANAEQTSLSSSGLKWTILVAVFLLLALFGYGCSRKER
ncbi:MAG: Aerobic cobaltochelatase subunit CobN [Lentisphaerae bacterium ADurb.Bin242]|nr:MAG: Aerobic cobaltochelatase subunit CobN [Lentisphaerae bacterium ADurb.Bin242]